MNIAIIIILALLLLYILFIVIPSVILFNFAFGRKECSIPLSESGDLRGTRYEPYQTELIAADTYVRSHPIRWDAPTEILYGEADALTPYQTAAAFAAAHGAGLTVMPGGEHWIHTDAQLRFLDDWLRRCEGRAITQNVNQT